MTDPRAYMSGITQTTAGVWEAHRKTQVSYPSEGNEQCAQLEDNSFWFAHRNRCIVSIVRGHAPEGCILDVGGGNGFVSLALVGAGFPTMLLEPGAQGIAVARQRGVQHIIHASLEDVHLIPNSIPAVGLFDVLEHIAKPIDFLRTIRTALSPNGLLYLTVPALRLLWSEEDVQAGHFRRYSLSSLSDELSSAGFEIRYATYFFSYLVLPILLLRSLPWCLGMRRTNDLNRYRKEHAVRPGIVGQLVALVSQPELAAISRGRKLPFGSSCLIVAQKKQQ